MSSISVLPAVGDSLLPTVQPPKPPANPFAPQKPLESAKHDGPRISFPLSDDNVMELILRKRISKRDFERLKKLIDLSEDSLVADDQQSE